jgi:hypothetical protein
MIQPVTQRPRARLDLLAQFVCFGEQAGVELAGSCIRRFPLKGLESYLLFYLPLETESVWSVLIHAARDIAGLFAKEEV